MQLRLNEWVDDAYDTLARRLKAARERRGLTQGKLAQMSGLRQPDISKIELGLIAQTTGIARLARALRVPVEWLEQGSGPEPSWDASPQLALVASATNIAPVEPAEPVPLVSWVRAGAWCEAHEPFRPEDVDQWMPCPVKHGPNTFALRVMGDSMDGPGGYREGEIIFVDPSIDAEPGKDVVVRTPEGAATFKRLKEDSEGRYLLALNPAFPDRVVRVPDGTVFCGVVIGSFTPR